MANEEPANRRGLEDVDRFYEALIAAHEGLDADASQRLNARLILLLAAEVGDDATLHSLLRAAIAAGKPRSSPADTG
jgi:hypothetical protein